MRFIQYLIIGENQVFGKLLTNQKIAHKIVKPYVYKALREGLKTHDNGKIQNLRGFDSLPLRRRVWRPNPLPFFTLRSNFYFDSITKILKTLRF